MVSASIVAQSIGLLLQWLGDRKQDEALDETSFLVWLAEHDHKKLREFIESNDKTLFAMRHLLSRRTSEILGKLNELAELQTSLASKIPGLEEVTSILAPEIQIPEPAFDLLRQMDEQKTEYFCVSRSKGVVYPRLNAYPGELTYKDGQRPRSPASGCLRANAAYFPVGAGDLQARSARSGIFRPFTTRFPRSTAPLSAAR